MKNVFLLLGLPAIMLVLGCSGQGVGKNRENAMREGGVASQGVRTESQPPVQLSAQASGGSNLPASAPYTQPNAPAVSQNLNAAPFLTSAGAPTMSNVFVSPQQLGLTSRAEGTMNGPSDRPAAGIGPGMTPVLPGQQGGKIPSRR